MTRRVAGASRSDAGASCDVASHRSRGRVQRHDVTVEEAEAPGDPDLPTGAQACHGCHEALQRAAARRAKLQTETCAGCGAARPAKTVPVTCAW